MGIGIGKTTNEYARMVNGCDASKTVWMAIAVSFADRLGLAHIEDSLAMTKAMRAEWLALYDNGIVPQKPPKGGR